MKGSARYLAFDLGAESGRAVIGSIANEKLTLQEIHRFPNGPVQTLRNLNWDVLRLFNEIKHGIGLACRQTGSTFHGIGLITWGLDFALLDHNGELIANPYCYRDPRTEGMMEQVFSRISKQEIFELTGIQFMQINSLYHLFATSVKSPKVFELADKLLMIPDLFNYWLTGVKKSEISDASTTQFFEFRNRKWSEEIFRRLDLPYAILPELVASATVLGDLLPSIAEYTGLKDAKVIAPACHDTASAFAAVPYEKSNYACISSGTWSAMGTEVAEPVISEKSLEYNFTNEMSAPGKCMCRKNIMGLWLLQECRRIWNEAEHEYNYGELASAAEKAKPFGSIVEPDHESFLLPGDMPARIKTFCRDSNQEIPENIGEIVRCIFESLALKYRWVLDKLEEILGYQLQIIHIVGGGSNSTILCQLTANATCRPVYAGPDEAATIGNIIAQAKARGHLASLEEGRSLIRSSFEVTEYTPHDRNQWDEFYAKFLDIKEKSTTLL